jgi:protein tyrosine phosphatase (PTP) superfamily phosphohydrolase (DUF442 family)
MSVIPIAGADGLACYYCVQDRNAMKFMTQIQRLSFFFLFLVSMSIGCDTGGRTDIERPGNSAGALSVRLPSREPTKVDFPKKLSNVSLPNALRIHDQVISGGVPVGEAAFRDLKKLGVRTIISVDGAKPDVDLARRFGMRYVHLPHGYDGISDERSKELALAVKTLEGPIYIHCHHGKHRSPAASAVACVMSGLIGLEAAPSILQVAGTNPNYIGLYASVVRSRKLGDSEWDRISSEFPETAELPPLAEAMVELDHTFEAFKTSLSNSSHSRGHHPPSELISDSLLLNEHFSEMMRLECVASESQLFQALLSESEADSRELLQTIETWSQDPSQTTLLDSTKRKFDAISARCTQCHETFRDRPQ